MRISGKTERQDPVVYPAELPVFVENKDTGLTGILVRVIGMSDKSKFAVSTSSCTVFLYETILDVWKKWQVDITINEINFKKD